MVVVKRVAVVGAGASGLVSVKTCLEAGLEVVGFERADKVGGLWHFTEKAREGVSCVHRSTVMNSSKEMSCFSDFPAPKEYPNFMPHKQVQQYFQDYSDHFGLERHIRYSTEVTEVKQAEDYAETGRWVISSIDHENGGTHTETFDAVLVASGHHARRNMPKLPGLNQFQGRVLHSQEFRPDPMYQDKKILVVGMGNSAADIAVELSRMGDQVYLSTRKGSWLFHCYVFGGVPWDVAINTRYENWKNQLLPFPWVEATAAAKLNQSINHDLFALTPQVMPFSHSPFLNDELGGRLVCGAVQLREDVKRFTSNGVEFKDGTYQDIDIVVLATGYVIGFPFVDKEVLDIKDNQVKFYKQMFHPDLQHQTMAFIGCIQPSGCLWPICELQARVATTLFKGELQLPSRQDMWKEINGRSEMRAKRYPNTLRHTLEIDWLPMMDELAGMIGCKPNLKRLLLMDPQLALKSFFGPCVPFQYRLEGPNSWSGAREATLTAMDRLRYPLQRGRALPANSKKNLIKAAEWVMFPPMSWVLFLEVGVVVLLLVALLG